MPKIIGDSLAEHREVIRQRIFTALTELLRQRGFDALSLADVAATAGVARTAMYNHFRTKEALLLAFADHETDQYVTALDRALEETDDPIEQLRAFVRRQIMLRRVYHVAPGPALSSLLSHETRERMREHARRVESILREILIRGMSDGVFPDQDIEVTVSLVNACLSGRNLPDGDAATQEHAIEATTTFVLRAVGAEV